VNVRQLLVGAEILAINQRHLADDLYQVGFSDLAQLGNGSQAGFAIEDVELDLDQLMIAEGAFQFGEDTFSQTVVSHSQNRFQMVADRFELFLLLLSERHNLTPASDLVKKRRPVYPSESGTAHLITTRFIFQRWPVARSKTSQNWLREHFNDPYVKMAQKDGYRSRASYKLLEIQEKDRLIRPGMTVIDLGAAPGGWSQVTSRLIGGQGRLIASDILEMDSIPDVTFIQGDFTEDAVLAQILEAVGNTQVDLVISDMAPNMSGLAAVDMPRAMFLSELALDLAGRVLRPGGDFLIKVFQGEGFDEYHKGIRKLFDKVQMRKPLSSRDRSREQYLLARGFRGIEGAASDERL